MKCPFIEICPTPNWYWYSHHVNYVKEVCLTQEHKICTHYLYSLTPLSKVEGFDWKKQRDVIQRHELFKPCPWLKGDKPK